MVAVKYNYLNLDIQAEGKIGVYSRAALKKAKVSYKNISLYNGIKTRNINNFILLQLVLFSSSLMETTNGCSTSALKAVKGSSLMVQDCRTLLALGISKRFVERKILFLYNRNVFCRIHQERTKLFAWLFETLHISRGERFQSCLLWRTLLFFVFLVSIQYLSDNTWIIKCGDISHVTWLLTDYFPQQSSHDLPRSGFRKTFHHLQRRERQTYIRTWILLEITRKSGWTILSLALPLVNSSFETPGNY